MADFSALTIVPATRAQVIESRKRTIQHWGIPLEIWEEIDQHDSYKDGKALTWVLVKRDDLESLDFYSACNTLRRNALVRTIQPNENGEDAVSVEPVTGYGVAAVFTPERYRKKGYAIHMLQLLHWVLAPESSLPLSRFPTELWGAPPERKAGIAGDAVFSVLYSAIGPNYYARCGPMPISALVKSDGDLLSKGWVVKNPKSTVWDLDEAPPGLVTLKKDTKEWSWIGGSDVEKLFDLDVELIKKEMGRPINSEKNWEVSFLPNGGLATWQFEWIRPIYSKLKSVPEHWGISSSSDGQPNAETMATWTLHCLPLGNPQITTSILRITRLRSSLEKFEMLMKQIMVQAKDCARNIEVWDLPDELDEIAVEMGGKTFQREGTNKLSSIKSYGQGEADWIHNEFFCWC